MPPADAISGHDMEILYPGSFDPITCGHVDIVRRLTRHYSKIHIAVLANPHKSVWFSAEERVCMIRESLRGIRGVEVSSYKGLLVDYARKLGVKLMVRGLRAISDFDNEFKMSLANKDLAPDVETIFMITDKRYAFLSSSLVKEISLYGGNLATFVPSPVRKALRAKVKERLAREGV